jgi:hypothetical protein
MQIGMAEDIVDPALERAPCLCAHGSPKKKKNGVGENGSLRLETSKIRPQQRKEMLSLVTFSAVWQEAEVARRVHAPEGGRETTWNGGSQMG